jgi:hypothetical protein
MTDIEQVVSKVEEAAEIADAALKGAAGGIRDHNQFRPHKAEEGELVDEALNGAAGGGNSSSIRNPYKVPSL